ncbi:YzbB protein [Geofilum rubicundum JCM 15548]|uniref:YzbB protein n=2 Tax=Geofilum TaxID=1236988 RepID=A0A0E9LXX2_9BACT|nr:YzbB protein [Geofilum rubicundum JCM 15548]
MTDDKTKPDTVMTYTKLLPVKWMLVLLFFLPVYVAGHEIEDPCGLELGAEQSASWFPMLEGKKVGLLVNHTSVVKGVHLLDTMLALGVDVQRIFVPEHGFRGTADAGELIKDGVDVPSGLPIVSLYGASKKPDQDQMKGLEVVVFDIQDVGVRFYTYISSMHYMMEACAENDVPMVVFDRPNPNGDYVDGPVLKAGFTSFVGMHPIPVVHGLTVGELALMINGERWLKNGTTCELIVLEMNNYRHDLAYSLPVNPSPNLPNDLSIRLYPSLCFFEGTEVSVGRGTEFPFQVIGYPDPAYGDFSFTPAPGPGARHPLQSGQRCYGLDLRNEEAAHRFTLRYFLEFYERSGRSDDFISRRRFFNLLAGTDRLAQQIEAGWSEAAIRADWQEDLKNYRRMRECYLLYP